MQPPSLNCTNKFFNNDGQVPITSISEKTNEDVQSIKSVQTTVQTSQDIIVNLMDQRALELERIWHNHRKLNLFDADKLLQEISKERKFHYLSPMLLLLLEMTKCMHEISCNKSIYKCKDSIVLNINGKLIKEKINANKLVRAMAAELKAILTCLIDDSEEQKLNEAKDLYLEVSKKFIKLEGIVNSIGDCNAKLLLKKIKEYMEVIYFIVHNNSFLTKCNRPFSPLNAIVVNPPSARHINLYVDALNNCIFSMGLFQEQFKDDFTKPLQGYIDEFTRCMRKNKNSLILKDYTSNLMAYLNVLMEIYNEYFPQLERVIEKSNDTATLSSLTTYYCNIESKHYSRIESFEKMCPLAFQLKEDWISICILLEKMRLDIDKKFELTVKNMKNSIDNLNEMFNKMQQGYPLSNSIKENLSASVLLSNPNKFLNLYNSLIDSFQVTSIAVQEMSFFFDRIGLIGTDFKGFQQSLLDEQDHLPCSSIGTFNFFIIQIVNFFEFAASNGLPLSKTRDEVVTMLLSIINAYDCLNNDSPIVKNILQNNTEVFKNIYKDLVSVYEEMNKLINSCDEFKDHRINHTIEQLALCLNLSRDSEVIQCYLIGVLLNSLGKESRISSHDLPIILDHMKLIMKISDQINLKTQFIKLELHLKEIVDASSDKSLFFWKRNATAVTLAKFEILNILRIYQECNQNLQTGQVCNEIIEILDQLRKQMLSFDKYSGLWAPQLSLLSGIARHNAIMEIIEPLSSLAMWISWSNFFGSTLTFIAEENPPPKVVKITANPVETDNKIKKIISIRSSEEMPFESPNKGIESTRLLIFPLQTYQPSEHLKRIEILHNLKGKQISLLNENVNLQFFRQVKVHDLLDNSCCYLSLLKEYKNYYKTNAQLPVLLQLRRQIDFFLLLESTQKIALSFLPVETQNNSNIHILISKYQGRPLINSHDGEYLSNLIHAAGKKWFQEESMIALISLQELHLKRIYWFQQDPSSISDVSCITTCCAKVWNELDLFGNLKRDDRSLSQWEKDIACRSLIHEHKRNNAISAYLTSSKTSLQNVLIQKGSSNANSLKKTVALAADFSKIEPQCHSIVERVVKAIERLIDFNLELESFEQKASIPLYFAMRSSEIQVSALTLTLQLALSRIRLEEGHPPPLFLDEKGLDQGRPLHYCHHIIKLWSTLKRHLKLIEENQIVRMLDTYLPVFAGDPRYPYPNKSAITNTFVNMHEIVYLLQLIEDEGFLSDEDKKLFNKYLGEGGWRLPLENQILALKQKTSKAMQDLQEKTNLSLYLAEAILNLILL